jgi:hypothetical protein
LKVRPPATAVGVDVSVVPPLPRWPPLLPQQSAWFAAFSAQAKLYAPSIDLMPELLATASGVAEKVLP